MIEKATNGRKPSKQNSKQKLCSKILHLQKSVVSLLIQLKDMKLTRFLAKKQLANKLNVKIENMKIKLQKF